MSDPTPPRSPLTPYRAYVAYISPSPKTHALIKAPLSRLARRATDLADTITGGTASNHAEEERREREEKERKNTCRACKVVFAGEKELHKHLNLFPAHLEIIEARRQGHHRPRHARHSASASAALDLGHTNGSISRPKRSRSRSRVRGSAATPSTNRYADALEEFENIGPVVATRSKVRSQSGPLSLDAPGPLIDYASRNEAQGRESAARVAQEEELRRVGRAAEELGREQDERNGTNRRGNDRAAIAQSMRRGLSEGMLTALATLPTRAAPRPSGRQRSFQERTAHLPFTFNSVTGEVDSESESDWELESSANYGGRSALQVAPTMISFRTGFSSQDDPSRPVHTSGPSPATAEHGSLLSVSPTQTLVDEPAPLYTANALNTRRSLPPVPPYEPHRSVSAEDGGEPFPSLIPASGEGEVQAAIRLRPQASISFAVNDRYRDACPSTPGRRPQLSSRRSANQSGEAEHSPASPSSPLRYNNRKDAAQRSPTTPRARRSSSPDMASPAGMASPYTPRTPYGAGAISATSTPYRFERTMSDAPALRQTWSQDAAPVSPTKATRPPLWTQNTGGPSRSVNPVYEQARINNNTGTVHFDNVADLVPPLANLILVPPPGAPAFPPPPTPEERRRRRGGGQRGVR